MAEGLDELVVRATIRDELSAGLRNIRQELKHTGEEAKHTGEHAGAAVRGFDHLAEGVKELAKKATELAAVGFAAVTGAMLEGLKRAADYQLVTTRTANVIKTSGGAAHVTAGHVKELSKGIAEYSLFSDEAVQSGANLLLTFTNIRNQAGKGNDIFDQSTTAVANLSQAMGQDMKSSAVQLGKALNDPVKGVTALQRVGVSFTATQKAQIKQMATHNNLLGAQKLILGEMNREFGGAAKTAGATFSGTMTHLKHAAEDGARDIMTPLLPIADHGIKRLSAWVPGAVEKLSKGLGKGITDVRAIVTGFKTGGLNGVEAAVSKAFGPKAAGIINKLITVFSQAWKIIKQSVIPAFHDVTHAISPAFLGPVGLAITALKFFSKHTTLLRVAIEGLVAFLVVAKVATMAQTAVTAISAVTTGKAGMATKLWALAQKGLNLVMESNPIGLVIAIIAGLVVAVIAAWKHSQKFRDVVMQVWSVVAKGAGAFVGMVIDALAWLVDKFFDAAGSILHAASSMLGWVPGVGDKLKSASAAFDTFHANVTDSMHSAADKAREMGNSVGENYAASVAAGIAAKQAAATQAAANMASRVSAAAAQNSYVSQLNARAASNAPAKGKHKAHGDTSSSRAYGAGGLSSTLRAHAMLAKMSGSRPTITNALVGGGGLGRGSGDHQAGRALDLQGPGLNAYASATRATGGFAEFHGSGSSRHLHAVPAAMGDTSSSRARGGGWGGDVIIGAGAIVVQGLTPGEAAAAVQSGIERYVRDRRERG